MKDEDKVSIRDALARESGIDRWIAELLLRLLMACSPALRFVGRHWRKADVDLMQATCTFSSFWATMVLVYQTELFSLPAYATFVRFLDQWQWLAVSSGLTIASVVSVLAGSELRSAEMRRYVLVGYVLYNTFSLVFLAASSPIGLATGWWLVGISFGWTGTIKMGHRVRDLRAAQADAVAAGSG